MPTGLETLGNIDRTLQQARSELREIDAQIDTVTTSLATIRRELGSQYRALALARLKHIGAGDLVEAMDAADRAAVALLEQRNTEIASLETRIADAELLREDLRQRRESAASALASAGEQLDALEAAVQQQLQGDPKHRELAAASHAAELHAGAAGEKASLAEQDRIEKGKPFESEPLFMYLWHRKFGTPGYRSSGLIRMLDAWVARICNYRRARPNYAMLLEIPLRLREHADALRGEAGQAIATLEHYEKAALDAAGAPVAREALDKARLALEDIDHTIEGAGEEFRALIESRNLYAEGRDARFLKAIEALEVQMQREDMQQLRAEARLTPGPEDDRIVEAISRLEDEALRLEDILSEHRGIHAARVRRLAELEQLRKKFTGSHYDDIHSTFPQGDVIGSVLEDFLRGMVNPQQVWRTIGRTQRPRRIGADPGFGSGVFGRPTNPWHTPAPGRVPRQYGGRPSPVRGAPNRIPSRPAKPPSPPPFRTGGSF